MKFGVSLYSYYGSLNRGLIKEDELVKKSKELGFEAIEAVDFVNFNCPDSEKLSKAKALKDEADAAGLPITSLAVSADFINGSDGDLEAEVEKAKSWIDVAEALGVTRMRVDMTQGYARDSGNYKSFDSLLPTLVKATRAVADYAKTKDIIVMTENHGFFSQDSERVEKLCNEVSHTHFALLCDIGNFICADENPALAVTRVAPYTKYVHVKDFIVKPYSDATPGEGFFRSRGGNFLRGTIVGHGNIPVKHCLYQLRKSGYNDFVSIEFEGLEESVMALQIGLANLKRYDAEIDAMLANE